MSDSVTYMKIDDLDLLIIRELKKNSRRSAAEIARKVGAGERTVLRRIEKLVNNKVITFSIVVNPLAFGYVAVVDIFLSIDSKRKKEILDELNESPEIFYIATGQDDDSISIQARFKNNEALFDYLYRKLPEIPGIIVKGFALIPKIIKTVDTWVPTEEKTKDGS